MCVVVPQAPPVHPQPKLIRLRLNASCSARRAIASATFNKFAANGERQSHHALLFVSVTLLLSIFFPHGLSIEPFPIIICDFSRNV